MKIKFLLFLLFIIFIVGCSQNPNVLAKCLTQGGAVMYGSESCGHCQSQKEMFGNDFQYVNYIDCNKNRPACQEAGIRGYPTWIIDGQQHLGAQSLSTLANLVGCK